MGGGVIIYKTNHVYSCQFEIQSHLLRGLSSLLIHSINPSHANRLMYRQVKANMVNLSKAMHRRLLQ